MKNSMKAILKTFLALLLISTLTFSCSNDDSSQPKFSETPTALAKFDGSNFGTYKGVFTGSTGTIVINLNDDNTKSAVLTIDGKAYTYTATETSANGQVTIGLTFTNGASSFDFNVSASGEEPNITNIIIIGHPLAGIEIQKEYSDKIVKCYIGTYTGLDKKNYEPFNMSLSKDKLIGLAARPVSNEEPVSMTGSVLLNTFMGTAGNGSFKGTITDENINGTWENTDGDKGTFSGKRAL
ncbi:hypothetical protein E0I26_05715 [Flavobacterium rhamnosiphilum]|uniref:Uncharacterized protein n=1 Tax=Flavobacterium rhamnosiphilum TaxID=2541724 RepID=A0A4R5F9R0_9FLAO|nr:hypothetical protein [Flavobacterium rhamnosiphilum]TDE45450.1 hypothetical protein E0I26_05715 [Flavobacterium rhamnosiphilum]